MRDQEYAARQAVRNQQQVPAIPGPHARADGALVPGQGDALAPSSRWEYKPPEVIINDPENVGVEAGSNPDSTLLRTQDGGYHYEKSDKGADAMEENVLSNFGFSLRNTILPTSTSDADFPPPDKYLPADHNRWIWNPLKQAGYPVKKDSFGDYGRKMFSPFPTTYK